MISEIKLKLNQLLKKETNINQKEDNLVNNSILDLFVEAANKMEGVGGENVSMLLGDFLSLYQETLAPLWKTPKGGILKERDCWW